MLLQGGDAQRNNTSLSAMPAAKEDEICQNANLTRARRWFAGRVGVICSTPATVPSETLRNT